MRKSTHEVNQRPPELHENGAPEFVENPSEFHENGAPEFVPLPDEFNRNAPVVEPEKRKTSTLQKIMLYLAAAGLVILGVITPVVRVNPPEEEPAVAAAETPQPVKATVTPSAVPPASTPKPNTPSPEPTAEPTETPVPLLTGTIHIVVYSEILDMERARAGEYPSAILAEETLDAATFTEYVLPPLPKKDGYNALGYVLLADSSEAYLNSLYTGSQKPHPIGSVALGTVLTAADLGIVPKNLEGVYEAEIHVVWGGAYTLHFYDGMALFGVLSVGFPIESDGLFYLAPFPTPQRKGKQFVGWCDVDGNLIDAVTFFDFFEKLPDAKTPEDRDFTKPIICKVYACWSDGSGGAPQPTEEPVEMCTITCHNCQYMIDDVTYRSGSVPKGTQVHIRASSTISVFGYFTASPYNISRGSHANPIRAQNYGTVPYVFDYVVTIEEDTEIWFNIVA